MTWGIIVHQMPSGNYYYLTMADDSIYDGMKKGVDGYGWKFIDGKMGIPLSDIDAVENKIDNLVTRVNEGEPLNLKRELASVF